MTYIISIANITEKRSYRDSLIMDDVHRIANITQKRSYRDSLIILLGKNVLIFVLIHLTLCYYPESLHSSYFTTILFITRLSRFILLYDYIIYYPESLHLTLPRKPS